MIVMKKTIVVTGTHLTPALAVIDQLRKTPEKWQIYYFGRRYTMEGKRVLSPEFRLLPAQKITLVNIPAGRLQRRFTLWTIPSLLRIPLGLVISFYHLVKIRPDVICSFGGYVSVPVVIAAKVLGIPGLTHEQTAAVGLANRINGLFVDRIAITFPQSRQFFPKEKTVLTGNPIRPEIFSSSKPLCRFPHPKPQIYLTGGSQGATALNQTVWKILPQLTARYNLIHQCGGHDYPRLKKSYQTLPKKIKDSYFLIDYLGPESIGWALNSDIIIGRSGANTVLEIAALGQPAILIPLPKTAHDEQRKNAKFLTSAGAGKIIEQKNLSGPILLTTIEEILANQKKYRLRAQKLKSKINLDAAGKIVKQIQQLARP